MTIRVKCPACQQTLKAEERHAGRTVRCPACRSPVTIPPVDPPAGEETLDPFAQLVETPEVEHPEVQPPRPKKSAVLKAETSEPQPAPTVSEDDVGEWLNEGAPPPQPSTEELVDLPPQSPNWDGTTSTYDIAQLGPDDPPPPRKRRKKQ